MATLVQKFPREKFLQLIRSGHTEPKALALCGVDPVTFEYVLATSKGIREELALAKKTRADVFYEKIVDSVDNDIDPKEVPIEKLRFDKLKYLAAIDNPEKYSEKVKHEHNATINIFQEIKDLTKNEVKDILALDPFTVDAEFTPIEEPVEEAEGDDDFNPEDFL